MKDSNTVTPLYLQLYRHTKRMIYEGKLPKDSKLQSIRQASLRHGVSTTTMEHAYNQLLIEGYIRSVPKKGYFIETVPTAFKKSQHSAHKPSASHAMPINIGQTQDMFDPDRYRKIMNEILSDDQRIFEPCHPTGEWSLKVAIAAHLRSARDVVTYPDNVLVAAGIQQLLVALGSLFNQRLVVAYLKPGFKRALDAFKMQGFTLEGFETIEALLQTKPDLIYLSPSNQYPSGAVMPIRERLDTIRHATRIGAYILEDDYNHLFRYNAYQIPTLHSLSSKKRVVYIGSFSRNTMVSLRMGYMVLPDTLLEAYDADAFAQTVSKPEQLTMARFIEEGHYRRHLKRLSKISKRKNDALKTALEPYRSNDRLDIYGLESNMHFVIRLKHTKDKEALMKTLESMAYAYRTFVERPMDVLIPYSGIPSSTMQTVMKTLLDSI